MSDITVPSELGLAEDIVTSAEEVVLNARRKQAILLGIFVMFQAECRARFGFGATRYPSLHNILQLTSSDTESLTTVKDYFAATKIQATFRGNQARHLFRRARLSSAKIQSLVRCRCCRFAFSLVRRAVVTTQAISRGFVVRILFARFVGGRLVHYRQLVFQLWKKTGTSLCYRSILWWFIETDRLLSLCIAEDEVRRLGTELGMPLPQVGTTQIHNTFQGAENGEKFHEKLKLQGNDVAISALRDGARLGVTNQFYVQSLVVRFRSQ